MKIFIITVLLTALTAKASAQSETLLTVTSVNKDTLFLLEDNPTCKHIRAAWDDKIIKEKPPVFCFVKENELLAIYRRRTKQK